MVWKSSRAHKMLSAFIMYNTFLIMKARWNGQVK